MNRPITASPRPPTTPEERFWTAFRQTGPYKERNVQFQDEHAIADPHGHPPLLATARVMGYTGAECRACYEGWLEDRGVGFMTVAAVRHATLGVPGYYDEEVREMLLSTSRQVPASGAPAGD